MDIVKASFRPEFINRIDEITLFHKLDKSNIKEIADIQIKNIENGWPKRISVLMSMKLLKSGLSTTAMIRSTVRVRCAVCLRIRLKTSWP